MIKPSWRQDPAAYHAPPGSQAIGDLGYQGAEEINPRIKFIIPLKKPKQQELTESDKKTNKIISSIRIRVEHPLSYLKHFAILASKFRNRIEKSHQPFVNLACLYNFTRTHR